MKRLICRLIGHKPRYNFHYLPSKCICSRCHRKWVATFPHGHMIDGDSAWEEVEAFKGEGRSDAELSEKWFR